MEIINKEIANDVKDLILTSSGTIVGVSNPLLGTSIIIANECAKKWIL